MNMNNETSAKNHNELPTDTLCNARQTLKIHINLFIHKTNYYLGFVHSKTIAIQPLCKPANKV